MEDGCPGATVEDQPLAARPRCDVIAMSAVGVANVDLTDEPRRIEGHRDHRGDVKRIKVRDGAGTRRNNAALPIRGGAPIPGSVRDPESGAYGRAAVRSKSAIGGPRERSAGPNKRC